MEIQNHMRYNLRLNLSDQTIRNRLAEAGLRNFRPATFPMLHDAHKQARLDWANAHSGWGLNEWRTVLFTDESRFTVRFSDGRIGVWRLSRERFQARFVRQVDRYGGGSVMVWAGVCYQGKTPLHIVHDSMTALKYRDDVLRPIAIPYGQEALGANFRYLDDNARPHRARIVREFMEQQPVQWMPFPAKSPDCNAIEHIWDVLGRKVASRNPRPQNVEELSAALLEEWEAITLGEIRNLIQSMPRRLNEVIASAGGPTRY